MANIIDEVLITLSSIKISNLSNHSLSNGSNLVISNNQNISWQNFNTYSLSWR